MCTDAAFYHTFSFLRDRGVQTLHTGQAMLTASLARRTQSSERSVLVSDAMPTPTYRQ